MGDINPNPSAVTMKVGVADCNDPGNIFIPSFQNAAAVTKSDATVFSPPAQALWIGGAGDVTVHMYGAAAGAYVTFTAVPAGSWLKLRVDQVRSTSTSATNMNRMW